MTFDIKSIATRIIAIAMLLLLASCSGDDGTETMVVSVAKSNVSASAGSHLVSITCSTSWQLALTYSSEDEDWASLSTTSGSGNTGSVVLSYEANEVASPRTLTIVLSSRKGETSCTFTQEAGTVSNDDTDEDGGGEGEDGGDGEDDSLGDSAATLSSVPAWMELPAMSVDDGLYFLSHSMTVSGTATRNYSLYYDVDNLVSHWVAYPLNDWLKGSGNRSNAWGVYDPLVPEEYQANLASGFKSPTSGVSYDRGHQLPSADRYHDNESTFYPTNMTPQISAFNQNIWANFESTVRGWASNSDTLYVVTGCVVEGSTTFAYDNDYKKVTVPVAYYKALLRYTKASTIGYSGYIGAAFYLEHRSYSESNVTASMSMSIDDLEEKLGIDFFVNLPDLIGETAAANVEKQQPSSVSWWGLSD